MLPMNMEAGKRRYARTAGRLGSVPQPKKGLKLAGVRLRPDQLAALRREAMKRAEARGSVRPDQSEIIREAFDLWLATAKPRHKP